MQTAMHSTSMQITMTCIYWNGLRQLPSLTISSFVWPYHIMFEISIPLFESSFSANSGRPLTLFKSRSSWLTHIDSMCNADVSIRVNKHVPRKEEDKVKRGTARGFVKVSLPSSVLTPSRGKGVNTAKRDIPFSFSPFSLTFFFQNNLIQFQLWYQQVNCANSSWKNMSCHSIHSLMKW